MLIFHLSFLNFFLVLIILFWLWNAKNQRVDVLQGNVHDHSHPYLHTHPIPSHPEKFRADFTVERAVTNIFYAKEN